MGRVEIDLPESFDFSCQIPIRIGDINYGGHLGNDAVLALAHEARLLFLKQYGFSEKDVGGCGIIMADAVVIYRSEAFYEQTVNIEVGVVLGGKTSCDIVYQMTDTADERAIATVKTGIVFFDYERRRPARAPKAFVEAVFRED